MVLITVWEYCNLLEQLISKKSVSEIGGTCLWDSFIYISMCNCQPPYIDVT